MTEVTFTKIEMAELLGAILNKQQEVISGSLRLEVVPVRDILILFRMFNIEPINENPF